MVVGRQGKAIPPIATIDGATAERLYGLVLCRRGFFASRKYCETFNGAFLHVSAILDGSVRTGGRTSCIAQRDPNYRSAPSRVLVAGQVGTARTGTLACAPPTNNQGPGSQGLEEDYLPGICTVWAIHNLSGGYIPSSYVSHGRRRKGSLTRSRPFPLWLFGISPLRASCRSIGCPYLRVNRMHVHACVHSAPRYRRLLGLPSSPGPLQWRGARGGREGPGRIASASLAVSPFHLHLAWPACPTRGFLRVLPTWAAEWIGQVPLLNSMNPCQPP